MKLFTKEELVAALCELRSRGWIRNARPGNVGGVGNTLEDLLGIEENNLPIPNASEWELKTQRRGSSSLTTLFHMEPSPRALRFVPKLFLPKYGWLHEQAGTKYPENEMSFRQTFRATARTDRGFGLLVNHPEHKVEVTFDSTQVAPKHADWMRMVERNIGLGELAPQPYWGFDDLYHKAATKLLNCFFIRAKVERRDGQEFFHYTDLMILTEFTQTIFIKAIEEGLIYVDFDARTGHNHGTKFRFASDRLPALYESVTVIP